MNKDDDGGTFYTESQNVNNARNVSCVHAQIQHAFAIVTFTGFSRVNLEKAIVKWICEIRTEL